MQTWILTDGRTGTENNAKGLAEAFGLSYELKHIALRQPWKSLAPYLRMGLANAVTPAFTPPYPNLVISAGRTPAAAALALKQRSPRTLLVHITDPGIDPAHFDLVIAPEHDGLTGPNVVTTKGALHRVTKSMLEAARTEWMPRWHRLYRPWHGVLIGGPAHGYKMSPALVSSWLDQLQKLGGSLLVTTSRRTPPAIVKLLQDRAPHVLWTGEGDNPYQGILACADNLFVTNESVSMLSEALAVGKPVFTLPLEGATPKFDRFNDVLLTGGYVRPLALPLPASKPHRLDDMERAAEAVKLLIQNAPAVSSAA